MTTKRIRTYEEMVAVPDVLPVRGHPNTWHCLRHGEFRSRRQQPECPACTKGGAA